MERAEVRWVDPAPPPTSSRHLPKRHMAVLLSWDTRLGVRDRVTVAPITTNIRSLDSEVLLDHRDGLPRACVVNCDVLTTVLRSTVKERVTLLGEAKMRQIERAIHLALGIKLPCTIA